VLGTSGSFERRAMPRELAAALFGLLLAAWWVARRAERRRASTSAALAESRPAAPAPAPEPPREATMWILIPGARADGHHVYYCLTREARHEDCEDRRNGVCIQRVLRSDAWAKDEAIHGAQHMLS
jgi:hypothetical protein